MAKIILRQEWDSGVYYIHDAPTLSKKEIDDIEYLVNKTIKHINLLDEELPSFYIAEFTEGENTITVEELQRMGLLKIEEYTDRRGKKRKQLIITDETIKYLNKLFRRRK